MWNSVCLVMGKSRHRCGMGFFFWGVGGCEEPTCSVACMNCRTIVDPSLFYGQNYCWSLRFLFSWHNYFLGHGNTLHSCLTNENDRRKEKKKENERKETPQFFLWKFSEWGKQVQRDYLFIFIFIGILDLFTSIFHINQLILGHTPVRPQERKSQCHIPNLHSR